MFSDTEDLMAAAISLREEFSSKDIRLLAKESRDGAVCPQEGKGAAAGPR